MARNLDVAMSTIIFQENVRIPFSVVDLDSFRQWAKSDEFPDRGRYSFLNGELWVDLMPEQLFTHNSVKVEFSRVLNTIMRVDRRGRFFGDGTLVTNVDAGLSTEPDGTVVLFDSLKRDRVRLIEAADEGFIEIAGAPDIVLEIVSAGSVQKDTVVLRDLYWQAGVAEYWLVDVRGDRLEFDVLKRGRHGYLLTRKQAGWVRSAVIGQSFRLTSHPDAVGNPEYTLAVH
jgi:Uma2 family endonuclease